MTRPSSIRSMALCALCAALMAICAWISIPFFDIAFTMQTFAIFLALGLLGGKLGSAACLVYLLLGAVGLPVFSGFQGGFGILLGVTGGYLWGFLAAALVYWVVTAVFPKLAGLPAMILGLLTCYACGTGWFLHVYAGSSPMGLGAVLLKCVVPYLLPDGAKLWLALVLSRRLRSVINPPPGT